MRRGLFALRVLVVGLFFYGVVVGLRRGGEDFRVFHFAASLILEGRGAEIYTQSPDRFLYSPGIAWLLSPFALLPWKPAFLVWSLLKGGVLFILYLRMRSRWGEWASLLSFVLFARPMLIEIRYGQVNLLILCAVYFFLDAFLRSRERVHPGASLGLAAAALTKIFPGVVALVALMSGKRGWKPIAIMALGAGVFSLLPAISEGLSSVLSLHQGWFLALQAKGFPTETHNQSIPAILFHLFGAEHYYSLTLGAGQPGMMGMGWVPMEAFRWIALGVTVLGLLVLSVLSYRVASRGLKDTQLIAGLVLPSHLIWKPYFIFGIPLAAETLARVDWNSKKHRFILGALFLGMNFTTLDVLGPQGTALFEAAGGLLWIYLGLIVFSVSLASKRSD